MVFRLQPKPKTRLSLLGSDAHPGRGRLAGWGAVSFMMNENLHHRMGLYRSELERYPSSSPWQAFIYSLIKIG
jgi:hypothetical protein